MAERDKSEDLPSGRRGGPGRKTREAIYAQLDDTLADVNRRLGGLPAPAEARAIWDELWVHDTHNSTAIEGNTLVLKEVEQLLHDGLAVGNKELKDYMEVRGYADAATWVYGHALDPVHEVGTELLTLTEVRRLHQMAMTPVWDVAPHPDAGPNEGPGSFREHDIHPFPGGMQPPSWALVEPRLRDWLDRVNAIRESDVHAMEAAAAIHVGFEQVHPFIDGNGRTGRLLLNLVLCRLGYAPAIIQNRERPKYLRALRQADGGNFGPLGEQIARAVLDNVLRFVVPALAGPARLVPLASLASQGLTVVALRAAVQRGRLKAQRTESGQWLSSRAWVDEYLASKHKRGV
ncbi:Fic family protein [Isoptericola dokdonensis]|uniref:Fic/DOC family protein n=1 Tax=Isoptericola dokdonensis DS-3 TaxID=1300344 RepID=A0A161IGF2_9MICO|nr:Fic family protein [Isoptericola dokdonensis]ANC32657.1 Fic/DOC family protein [Isoptericola dokdonensis DS-3]